MLANLAKSKTAFNKAAKNMSVADLEKLAGFISGAIANAKKREAEKEAKKKAAAVKKLQSMMSDMGLSADDIAGLALKTPAKRGRKPGAKKSKAGSKVAPKYEITVDGQHHQWTGRGRMPLVFKHHVENGGQLADCLITKP